MSQHRLKKQRLSVSVKSEWTSEGKPGSLVSADDLLISSTTTHRMLGEVRLPSTLLLLLRITPVCYLQCLTDAVSLKDPQINKASMTCMSIIIYFETLKTYSILKTLIGKCSYVQQKSSSPHL